MRRALVLSVTAVVLVLLTACSGISGRQPSSPQPTTTFAPITLEIVSSTKDGLVKMSGSLQSITGKEAVIAVEGGDCITAKYALVVTNAKDIEVTVLGQEQPSGSCAGMSIVRQAHLTLAEDPAGKPVLITKT